MLKLGIGLLAAKKARKAAKIQRQQAQEDASNKFVDLRAAAEKGGFSPLTALQFTGGNGFGDYPSSAPPLASIEILQGAMNSFVPEITGEAAYERQKDRLNFDIAKLQLDQARSGVALHKTPYSSGAVGGISPFADPPASVYPKTTVQRGGANVGKSGTDLDALDVMVPTKATDGSVHLGPNPNGPDLETGLWAVMSDAYYRRQNYLSMHTVGIPLSNSTVRGRSENLWGLPSDPPPSVNPWRRALTDMPAPASSPGWSFFSLPSPF